MVTNPVISAFEWVPDFARGQVRDLRLRWAFEEVGQAYDTTLFDASKPRSEDYKQWQPFGQVPAFRDDHVQLFESGAELLYIGQQHERLLPRDGQAHWDAVCWLFAALNSVEPMLNPIVIIGFFNKNKDWSQPALESVEKFAKSRLTDLSAALGDKEWLAGQFSIADIAMVTVLRILDHTDMLQQWPNLVAYRERGMARPAFARAHASQLADFRRDPKGE